MTNAQTFSATLDKIKDLPTIPHILFQVNRMLMDNDVSTQKMGDIIESDQAMTTKILKLVNSAFYGFRSRIIDIRQAVMILGFNTVRYAIAAVSIIDIFRAREKYGGFDIRELWKHSAAVAVTGKHLAERARLAPPADCFVAGLLHDIGKLVMAEHFTDVFNQVIKLAREEGISFSDAEREIALIDHAAIGGYLARKWQFPDRLVDAITYHHMVNRNISDFWMHVNVFAANIMVNQNYMENAYEKILGGCPEFSEVLPRLGALSEWHPAVNDEISEVSRLFLEGESL